jgi:hypothetical protein
LRGVGQPLAYYAGELRRRGWKEAIVCLPHDGVAHNNITGKRYIDHWREAGFECETPIKNSGAGAAMMRVEAARRIFPRCTNWQIQIAVAPAHAVTHRTMVAAPSPIERAKPVSTCLR